MSTKDIDNFIKWTLKDKTLLREIFAGDEEEAAKTSCLSDETLTELMGNVLSVEQVNSALAHIVRCDNCLDVFITSFETLSHRSTSIAEELAARIKSGYEKLCRFAVVIKLFPDHITPLILDPGFTCLQPSIPANIRGQLLENKSNLTVVAKRIDPFWFELEVEKIKEGLCQVQIYAKYVQTKKPAKNLRMSLSHNQREFDSYLTEGGKVVFDELKKGRYLIKASTEGKHICEFDLSLV